MESNPLVNETLLQMKYARVVNLIADKLDISHPQALEIFYNSQTYQHLSDLRNHLHNMSDAYLAEEIVNEGNCRDATRHYNVVDLATSG